MKPTNLYESLFILHKCNEVLKTYGDELKIKNMGTKALARIDQLSTNYIIMEACSFLDEFHANFRAYAEEPYKERVDAVKRIAKPIFKRINKWPHLQKFRNNIIAHPWREGKKFVVPDLNKYNVPRNVLECVILVDLIQYIYEIILFEFHKEHKESQEYMLTLIPGIKQPTDYSGLTDDLVQMAQEVENLAKENDREYHMKVVGYLFD